MQYKNLLIFLNEVKQVILLWYVTNTFLESEELKYDCLGSEFRALTLS